MWRIFKRRLDFGQWVVCDEDGVVEPRPITYLGEPPIMNIVRYAMQPLYEETRIPNAPVKLNAIDAGRIQLTPELEAYYFARDERMTIEKIMSEDSVHADIQGWLRLDVNFHISKLAPGRDMKTVCKYVRHRDLRGLVHDGGVDPLALRRFTDDPELLLEAIVMQMITDLTKDHKKVWLYHDPKHNLFECAKFMVTDEKDQPSSHMLALRRLVADGAVMLRADPKKAIALSWMAEQEQKFLEEYADVERVYEKRHFPESLGRARAHLVRGCRQIRGDPSMAVDRWIDRGEITTTMLPKWCMHEIPHHMHCANMALAKVYISSKLYDIDFETVVTISANANLSFEPVRSYMCLRGKKIVKLERGLFAHNDQSPCNESFDDCTYVGMVKFGQIPELCKHKVDVVIAVIQHKRDLRWLQWVYKWGEASKEVIAMFVGE